MTVDQVNNVGLRNFCDETRVQSLNAMISHIEKTSFEIDEISSELNADNLPFALGRDAVSTYEPINDKLGGSGALALTNEIPMFGIAFHFVGESQ